MIRKCKDLTDKPFAVNFVVGANEDDTHIINVNLSDFSIDEVTEIRKAEAGEICPRCNQGRLKAYSGIEVGNIFMLGTKYSQALDAMYVDAEGNEKPFVMGSYGIGITRTAQAAIEAFHDEKGIIWPKTIAPYDFHIIPINMEDEQQSKVAFDLYEQLKELGFAVLIDDRDERPGVKFNDADLIGIPVRISVGERGLKENAVEIVIRRTMEVEKAPIEKAASRAAEIWEEL